MMMVDWKATVTYITKITFIVWPSPDMCVIVQTLLVMALDAINHLDRMQM